MFAYTTKQIPFVAQRNMSKLCVSSRIVRMCDVHNTSDNIPSIAQMKKDNMMYEFGGLCFLGKVCTVRSEYLI
jgi:hypothetical protein